MTLFIRTNIVIVGLLILFPIANIVIAQGSTPFGIFKDVNTSDLVAMEAVANDHVIVSHTGLGSTWVVTYADFESIPDDGFTVESQAAFQRAVEIWADHIESEVDISVFAQFRSLDFFGVGYITFPRMQRRVSGMHESGFVYMPIPLANSIDGTDNSPGVSDIGITLNKNFPFFYFGTDSNPGTSEIDMVTVAMHQMGHGLGFSHSGRLDNALGSVECTGVEGEGCWGYRENGSSSELSPSVFDFHIEDDIGTSMLDESMLPNPSVDLGSFLTSEVFFGGTFVRQNYNNSPMPIVAIQSSSFRIPHWRDSAFPSGSSNAMMTGTIDSGEAYVNPGQNTCALLADIGWSMGPGCLAIVAAEPPSTHIEGSLNIISSNPGSGPVILQLSLQAPTVVRIEMLDIIGRTLAVLHDSNEPIVDLEFESPGHLPAGNYLVRVRGDGVNVIKIVTRL